MQLYWASKKKSSSTFRLQLHCNSVTILFSLCKYVVLCIYDFLLEFNLYMYCSRFSLLLELRCYSCFDIAYNTECNKTIQCPSVDHVSIISEMNLIFFGLMRYMYQLKRTGNYINLRSVLFLTVFRSSFIKCTSINQKYSSKINFFSFDFHCIPKEKQSFKPFWKQNYFKILTL